MGRAAINKTSGTPRCKTASDTTGAQDNQGATVKDHRSKGLRFRALGTMDRQLDQDDAIQVSRLKRALASSKIAD